MSFRTLKVTARHENIERQLKTSLKEKRGGSATSASVLVLKAAVK